MKVIDGRNDHAVPTILTECQFEALHPERLATYLDCDSHTSIKVYRINNEYVVGSYRDNTLILCGAWKTMRGVSNWLKKQYPQAEMIC